MDLRPHPWLHRYQRVVPELASREQRSNAGPQGAGEGTDGGPGLPAPAWRCPGSLHAPISLSVYRSVSGRTQQALGTAKGTWVLCRSRMSRRRLSDTACCETARGRMWPREQGPPIFPWHTPRGTGDRVWRRPEAISGLRVAPGNPGALPGRSLRCRGHMRHVGDHSDRVTQAKKGRDARSSFPAIDALRIGMVLTMWRPEGDCL